MTYKVRVHWSRHELAAAIEAVSRASADQRGYKEASRQLRRGERALARRQDSGARAALDFGEKSLGLLRVALGDSDGPTERSAISSLERAVEDVAARSKLSVTGSDLLTNPAADARSRRVRHVTGAQPPTR